MTLFKKTSSQLIGIKEVPFKLERDIQQLFEANLSRIMDVELVRSEFTIKNKRIDTLAFDAQTNAFVIIEFKRDRSSSVVDQGFMYLSLMLQNKADFILEYNETHKNNLKRDDVDWSQSRVAFVSPSFTENQREATNFKDLAIELWEVKRFENDIISINPIRKTNAAESIKPIMQSNKDLKQVTEEIKTYTEESLLQGKPEEVVELYEKFKNAIIALADDIEVKALKYWISFKIQNNIICSIDVQKRSLKLYVNLSKGQLDDPKKLADDVSQTGHWGNGDYQLKVSDDKDLEYIMSLVKQAIK